MRIVAGLALVLQLLIPLLCYCICKLRSPGPGSSCSFVHFYIRLFFRSLLELSLLDLNALSYTHLTIALFSFFCLSFRDVCKFADTSPFRARYPHRNDKSRDLCIS